MVDISRLLDDQKAFFNTGATRDVGFRIRALKSLRAQIRSREGEILAALHQDLGKPAFEAYGGEIAMILGEINLAVRHLRTWSRPRRVRPHVYHWPATGRIHREPYGSALIMAPWNYPFQLCLMPLAGAIAAGNCAVVKPSELTSASAALIADLIRGALDPRHVSAVTGDASVSKELVEAPFDYIFFTGSHRVGALVAQAAARRLTPATLELGGKNPCIVHGDADLATAARRICWGKFFNAGQSCVAPDYLLVHTAIAGSLLEELRRCIRRSFGERPIESPDYARIVSAAHVDRLAGLLTRGTVVTGGACDRHARFLEPTIVTGVSWSDPVMQEEIFGPILPVIEYGDLDEAIAAVRRRPQPLALYLFSTSRDVRRRIMQELSFGGGCINDTLSHLVSNRLPFGGVGSSGMGAYHGRASFDTFSRPRGIVTQSNILDPGIRYPPYGWKVRLARMLGR